jgi:hypothetical protein
MAVLRTLLKTLMKGAGAFLIGSIVLAQLAAVTTDYSNDQAKATEIRNELGATMQASAVGLSRSLALTIDDALPNAQVRLRCDSNSLPDSVETQRAEVCPNAALGEMLEEQEEGNNFLTAGAEARAFAQRLRNQLEDDEPAAYWDVVVSGFRDLGRLGNSDTCNEDRIRRVDTIRGPAEGAPISERDNLLDEPLLVTAERYRYTQQELDELELLPDESTTVRDALVGSPTSTARCDRRDEELARFQLAVVAIREALVDESGLIASAVQDVKVEGVNDKSLDVWLSLWSLPVVIALIVGLLLWGGAQFIRVPESATKVTIVRNETDDGGQPALTVGVVDSPRPD